MKREFHYSLISEVKRFAKELGCEYLEKNDEKTHKVRHGQKEFIVMPVLERILDCMLYYEKNKPFFPRNQTFRNVKSAFNWLLGSEYRLFPFKPKEDPYLSVMIKVGDLAQITKAQFKGSWMEEWINLKGPDRQLALSVINGKADVEFIDYIQDFYGVVLP